jgi:hypothetical protein
MVAPVMLSASLSAQGVFSNKTQSIVEKAIQDYPNHFYNIKGEFIGQASQASRYKSTLELPGASSIITFISAPGSQEESGWTCTLLRTASFEEASTRVAEVFGQLNNSIVTATGQKTFILSGQFEAPQPDKADNMIRLTLLPGVGEMKKVRVEILLHREGQEWTLSIEVNDDLTDMRQLAVTHPG